MKTFGDHLHEYEEACDAHHDHYAQIRVVCEGVCLTAALCTWPSTSVVTIGKENDYFGNKRIPMKYWIHIYIYRNLSTKLVIKQKESKK